jgi:hypothetical protein
MPTRIALPVLAILLAPFALAQAPSTPAPPEVDKALRARVTEFLQYHFDGNFRKAYDMVAEDTRDAYFTMGKVQIRGFKIGDVSYSDNFTKAEIKTTMDRTVTVAGVEMPVSMPSTLTWKVENGKWVWYKVPEVGMAGPFGLISGLNSSPAVAPAGPATTVTTLPKDFDGQTMAAAARNILQQVTVDKKEVTLVTDKASEERVVFHNGMSGAVQLELSAPDIPGFTAKIEQRMVKGNSDAVLLLRYEPTAGNQRRYPATVGLTVQPTNQTFVIQVAFSGSK